MATTPHKLSSGLITPSTKEIEDPCIYEGIMESIV